MSPSFCSKEVFHDPCLLTVFSASLELRPNFILNLVWLLQLKQAEAYLKAAGIDLPFKSSDKKEKKKKSSKKHKKDKKRKKDR